MPFGRVREWSAPAARPWLVHDDWAQRFAIDGYAVLRGAVPAARVRAAREAIGASIDQDDGFGQLQRSLDGTFCPDLVRHRDVLGLLDPVRPAIARLFADERRIAIDNAQIALRFPQLRAQGLPHHGFHVDGFPSGDNGVARHAIYRNTLLVGAYLTRVSGPQRGNFVAWPGSHRALARVLRELDAPRFLREHGAEALLERIRALHASVGTPVEVEVEPGDVVLAHHLLGHGAADNFSLRTREAVYFRVLHPDDHPGDPAPLLDETRFFDGVSFD